MNDARSLPVYGSYDVLDKRDTPSWDEATRTVVDDRIGTPDEPAWSTPEQWRALRALCDVIVPQRADCKQVPLAALVDRKIAKGKSDGYRNASLPALQDAWRIGLAALDDESLHRHRAVFADLGERERVGLVQALEHGALTRDAWRGMP